MLDGVGVPARGGVVERGSRAEQIECCGQYWREGHLRRR